MSWRIWLFATLGLAGASIGAALEYPSKERGLTADTAYQIGDVDHVNLFNGNLSVTLPLGRHYSLGPNLSYGLTLIYNSNVWDYRPEHCYDPINKVTIDYSLPSPNAASNSGVGWELHVGRLFAPNQEPWHNGPNWVYLASDGSRHEFYGELHPGAGTQPNTLFTNDGTYLRMRYFQDGDSKCKPVAGDSGSCRLVESPDGSVREFRSFLGQWKLTRLRDAFGNWLDLSYDGNTWSLADIHGRSHTVQFTSDRLAQVNLEGPGGTRAIYTPSYSQSPIRRQRYTKPSCAPADHDNTISVPLLTGLTQPDSSFWSMSYFTDWSFDSLSGGIQQLRLPSGGKMEWSYQTLLFPSQSPSDFEGAWMNNAQGVKTRTLYWDPSDLAQQGTWTYDYASVGNTPDPGAPAISCFHRQRVIDPVGNTTDYFFSSLRSAHQWAYGLPFTYCDPGVGGVSPAGPFLSEQWYEGSASPGNLKRSIWVEYAADGIAMGNGSDQESNARLIYRKEIFHDDGNKIRETIRDDFDGLGHFRRTLVRGDFGPEKIDFVEYFPQGTLAIDPETSLPLPEHSFGLPTGNVWLFGLFKERSLTQRANSGDPGTTSRIQTCYSPTTGFLSRTRSLAGSFPQGHDLLVEMVSETTGLSLRETGFVSEIKQYGGDQAAEPLETGDLCSMTLPDDPENWSRTSFSAGVPSRSVVVEPCDGTTEILQALHQEIDTSTGLPLRVYDSAGFGTSLSYDVMGRLVREDPDQGAATLHKHSVVTASSVNVTPSYQVESCQPGVGGDDCPNDHRRLSSRSTFYDGLGRPTSVAVAFPAEGNPQLNQSQLFERDAAGRTTFESTWLSPLGSSYSDHDRFGRVATIQPSGEEAVHISYRGERKTTRELRVATSIGETSSIFTTETRDHFGRQTSVCENQTSTPSGDGCTGLLTAYKYDQEDRIVEVCHAASGSSCGQRRRFTYDGRGFLIAEQVPEVGRTTADWTRYTFDAMGNALTKDIDGAVDIPLLYRYDRAGRLLEVKENDGGLRTLKEFFYARENDVSGGPSNTNWRAGKLVQARRHNWVQGIDPLPAAVGDVDGIVTDTYVYRGLGGRVSEKQTSLRLLSGTTAFRSGYAYDLLGQVNRIIYPRCADWPCYGADPLREISMNRKLGFLQEIPGYASFDYQLGGELKHHIRFNNGLIWEQQADSGNGLPRPWKISLKNAGGLELWGTGDYDYDGAGNIRSIGSLAYQYDGFGRLLKEVQGAATRQQATYDNFGNLTSLATAGSAFPIPVSATTNRLGGGGTIYRADGSLTQVTLGGERMAYTFDGLGQMKYLQTEGAARIFFYDAYDDRLLAWDCPNGNCEDTGRYLRWTVRGLGGETLRAYDETRRDNRRWLEDLVYQDGSRLLAAHRRNDETGGEDRFAFVLDHLGSTRAVYDWSGNLKATHNYYPFGQEVAAPAATDFKQKFTGHERDRNGSAMSQLDYMRARYTSPMAGRFLTVDPAGAVPAVPQSWNRYSYVLNRPMIFRDPHGLSPAGIGEFFWDVCMEHGYCSNQYIEVGASPLGLSSSLYVLFGYPTYGAEGHGIFGNSPDAGLFDFQQNIDEARAMGVGDLEAFYRNSKTGGKWDLKQLCPSSITEDSVPCQNFGNYHFGVISAAAGIDWSKTATLGGATLGAGVYQVVGSGGGSKPSWIWPRGSILPFVAPPHGDDPWDNFFITMGWMDYHE